MTKSLKSQTNLLTIVTAGTAARIRNPFKTFYLIQVENCMDTIKSHHSRFTRLLPIPLTKSDDDESSTAPEIIIITRA